MVGEVRHGEHALPCVYKPFAGERPLWDFPDGRLAAREVAAYRLSQAAGWDCVPATVLRDGPAGPGMVQQWIEDTDPEAAITVTTPDAVPGGWLPVFTAQDDAGRTIVVAHADTLALATIAVFDILTNNADRKGSHLLATLDGRILGVDHGLTFHPEPKLRTVLWGWAGQPIPEQLTAGLATLQRASPSGVIAELIGPDEAAGYSERLAALLGSPVFPMPPDTRPALPWPPL